MFKKTIKCLRDAAMAMLSSDRLKMMAVMLLICTTAVMAQNSAGDYTAGTTALTTVTEEIAKYVPIVVKLCYAIAGVVAVVGAISVYIAMNNGLFSPFRWLSILQKIEEFCARKTMKMSMI